MLLLLSLLLNTSPIDGLIIHNSPGKRRSLFATQSTSDIELDRSQVELVEQIGAGEFGEVWRGRSTRLQCISNLLSVLFLTHFY